MSKRLQVFPGRELAEIQRLARREHLTTAEWARRVLRDACAERPTTDTNTKLKAVRLAAEYSFPTAGIGQMLSQIEQGYLG